MSLDHHLEHYRQLLVAKETELLARLAVSGTEALHQTEPDVQDETDMAVRSEAADTLLNQNTSDFKLLRLVREALGRIQAGTYGKCLECEEPIEEKRLEAVPWAEYDLRHQEEADRAEFRVGKGPTL